jgi:Uma2 family endonuclease
MSQSAAEQIRWTILDLDLLPDNGTRYEIIDGELFMTRAPRWSHQQIAGNICTELNRAAETIAVGRAVATPGIIFSEADNVIPDVVWASYARLETLLDAAEHLTGAPELIVEVLSPGADNERRDREVKLKLYTLQGVLEYWIVDLRLQQVQVYRRQRTKLELVVTLLADDEITSPLLPSFSCQIAAFFR